jgi:periplasmic protein TonB
VSAAPFKSALDAPVRASKSLPLWAALGAMLIHSAIIALGSVAGAQRETALPKAALISEMVEIELPKPPEPPKPEAEPEPPKQPEPVRAVAKPALPRPAKAVREAPPPAAAQAGKVMAAADEVVDFGETIVSGHGPNYAGGVTESGGTAQHAVRDVRARAGGVEGGTGTALQGDKSRAPQLAGGFRWDDCPFPPEADDAELNHAVVTLRVEVGLNGEVTSVRVVSDPGHGFGREMRRCAGTKRWMPGLDRAGRPTSGVALVKVRLDR